MLPNKMKNLNDKTNKYINFPNMQTHYGEHMNILRRRGFYPDESVGGIEKLDFEGVPPLEAFHSQLKMRASSMMRMMIKTMR